MAEQTEDAVLRGLVYFYIFVDRCAASALQLIATALKLGNFAGPGVPLTGRIESRNQMFASVIWSPGTREQLAMNSIQYQPFDSFMHGSPSERTYRFTSEIGKCLRPRVQSTDNSRPKSIAMQK